MKLAQNKREEKKRALIVERRALFLEKRNKVLEEKDSSRLSERTNKAGFFNRKSKDAPSENEQVRELEIKIMKLDFLIQSEKKYIANKTSDILYFNEKIRKDRCQAIYQLQEYSIQLRHMIHQMDDSLSKSELENILQTDSHYYITVPVDHETPSPFIESLRICIHKRLDVLYKELITDQNPKNIFILLLLFAFIYNNNARAFFFLLLFPELFNDHERTKDVNYSVNKEQYALNAILDFVNEVEKESSNCVKFSRMEEKTNASYIKLEKMKRTLADHLLERDELIETLFTISSSNGANRVSLP